MNPMQAWLNDITTVKTHISMSSYLSILLKSYAASSSSEPVIKVFLISAFSDKYTRN